MEEELKSNLKAVFSAFSDGSPLSAATVWSRAARDARFMERLEAGGGFTVKSYDRAIAWFSENWPEGAIWPEGIERPAHSSEAAE
jgi:hypothetical protein